jgi:hypothetical protein
MYRCNVSNQHKTCYHENKVYNHNAFNWISPPDALDTSFARRMAMEDGEHIITASYDEIYRCSTMNPYSCATLYQYDASGHGKDDRTHKDKIQTIAVGGGHIFATFFKGAILSFDQVTSEYRVSLPLSMR